MKAVDFFCGAGGLTRGLMNSGIDVVLGIDVDSGCRRTYEENNYPAVFLDKDIRSMKTDEVKRYIAGVDKSELLFAACAPCQPFSKQRTNRSKAGLSTLLGEFSRFVERYKPGYVFIENVPGITRIPGNSTFNRFRRLLQQTGYSFEGDIVDAKSYGVPQTRRRYILLGSRYGKIAIPSSTHGGSLKSYVTVRQALSHLPVLEAGACHATIPNHQASRLSELNLLRIKHCRENGGDRRDWPDSLKLKCHTRHGYKGHTDVYGRMWWDSPAPALTCRCVSLSNGRYGHPEQNRAISLREAAALQSFDDTYVFYGPSKTHMASQIGNAVPVKLGEAIGNQLLRHTND